MCARSRAVGLIVCLMPEGVCCKFLRSTLRVIHTVVLATTMGTSGSDWYEGDADFLQTLAQTLYD